MNYSDLIYSIITMLLAYLLISWLFPIIKWIVLIILAVVLVVILYTAIKVGLFKHQLNKQQQPASNKDNDGVIDVQYKEREVNDD